MDGAKALQRFGFLLPKLERSVWVLGPDAGTVATAYPLIDAALRQRPGTSLVLSVPARETARLFQRLPHEIVLPTPAPFCAGRFVRRLGPALVVAIGCEAPGIRQSIRRLQVPSAAGLSVQAILDALPAKVSDHSGAGGASVWMQRFVRLAAGAPIASVEELSQRLGAPRSILCLGNGPSSESAEVAAVSANRLLRVNWIWRSRGLLAEPDMVFTADPDLPPRRRPPIVAFPSRAAGLPILARHCLFLRPPRAGYVFCDELVEALGGEGGAAPTNGAIMVAMAAALRPERLVIAGMDLYEHPAGRYPGDDVAADGYARQHSRDADIALIRAALADFDGEVLILSDALRCALGR